MKGKKETNSKVQNVLRVILRVLLGLAGVLLVLLVILKYDSLTPEALRRVLGRQTVTERTVGYSDRISFAAGSLNTYDAFDGGFAILSPSGLEVLDGSGDQVLAVTKSFGRPVLRSRGRYLAAYDVGGAAYVLVGEGELLQNNLSATPIVAADINGEGVYALVTEETNVRSAVSVYDKTGAPIYQYFSSERFLLDCAVDAGGGLVAVAGVRQNDARIVSAVMLLSVTSETPLAVWETSDELILSVRFLSDGSILAITETRAIFLDSSGAYAGSYDCGAAGIAQCRAGSDFVLLRPASTGRGADSSRIVAVDFSGKVRGERTVSGLLDIDAAGSAIGLLTNDAILVYNQDLERIAQRTLVSSSRNLLLGDGNAVFAISSDAADIYLY